MQEDNTEGIEKSTKEFELLGMHEYRVSDLKHINEDFFDLFKRISEKDEPPSIPSLRKTNPIVRLIHSKGHVLTISLSVVFPDMLPFL
jgi:hypothetical protein